MSDKPITYPLKSALEAQKAVRYRVEGIKRLKPDVAHKTDAKFAGLTQIIHSDCTINRMLDPLQFLWLI